LREIAEDYNPIPSVEQHQRIPSLLCYYAERPRQQQCEFWVRPDVLCRDAFASFYGYANDVIDNKASLDQDQMNTLMFQTW